ncbi:MAG: hypothetical protein IID40_06090, partial [Planctomycetes bacterium]|nr:hypothetical protein [Planctomycetota bacterium]
GTHTLTCGDPDCCLEYKLVDCRVTDGEPLCPGGTFLCPCDPTPGACCLPDATCVVTSEADCNDQDGNYQGDGTDCQPTGACCLADNTCVTTTQACCNKVDGAEYKGDDKACQPNQCCDVEPSIGSCVCLNDDDDNNNGSADLSDPPGTANEDDLVALSTGNGCDGAGWKWKLTFPGKVKVWRNNNRTMPVNNGQLYDLPVPGTLWVEGVAVSGAANDVTLTLSIYKADGTTLVETGQTATTVCDLEVTEISGLDAQNRVFTTLDIPNARGVAGPVALRATVKPADAIPGNTKVKWEAIDVDDPAAHIHLDPNDHDNDDNDGDGTVDNNDGVDNSGILTAAHMFTARPGYAISAQGETSVTKNVDGDADIDDGAERPVGSYTSVTGEAETALDAAGKTEVVLNATNDRGDNYRIKASVTIGGQTCEETFPPADQKPITVWTKLTAHVYAMNNPAGGVYYPFDAGEAAATRFDNFVNAYGDGNANADRAAYFDFAIADATTPASLGSKFGAGEKEQPYALTAGEEFAITVDAAVSYVITLAAVDFAAIGAATAAEVAAVINAAGGGDIEAGAITFSDGDIKLVIRSAVGAGSSLKIIELIGTPGADLGLPVDEEVTANHTAYFADILDDNNAIQFEEYFQLFTDYHGSEATNPPNPIDTLQLIGVRDQGGFLGATDRPPHSLTVLINRGGIPADKTTLHEPGHSFLAAIHANHTAHPAVIACVYSQGAVGTLFICPKHLRILRNSITRRWTGADARQTAD